MTANLEYEFTADAVRLIGLALKSVFDRNAAGDIDAEDSGEAVKARNDAAAYRVAGLVAKQLNGLFCGHHTAALDGLRWEPNCDGGTLIVVPASFGQHMLPQILNAALQSLAGSSIPQPDRQDAFMLLLDILREIQ